MTVPFFCNHSKSSILRSIMMVLLRISMMRTVISVLSFIIWILCSPSLFKFIVLDLIGDLLFLLFVLNNSFIFLILSARFLLFFIMNIRLLLLGLLESVGEIFLALHIGGLLNVWVYSMSMGCKNPIYWLRRLISKRTELDTILRIITPLARTIV